VGAVAQATTPTSPGWIEWDVTEQVQGLYGFGDNGLRVAAGGDGMATVTFCSREASAPGCDASRAPQLVLRFAE
jgi:hypothetical protein